MQSKAERIALIREVAKKFNKPITVAKQRAHKPSDDEDERLWTDAPKYAAEFYGEVYHQTVRYDKEWD